jgi:predicted MFS family arabinose efflux permease
MAQSIFATGMLLGGATGQVLGGVVGAHYGWQLAFFVVAIAGLIPSLALFSIQEPARGPRSEVVPIFTFLRIPAFIAMIAAGACVTFASVSLLTWGVDFAVSYKDFSEREASVALALIALFSSISGVLTGGWVADLFQKRFSFGRVAAIAMAFLLASPFLLLAIQTEEKSVVLLGLVISGFFMSWYHGPVTAVLHDMMPRRAHATSVGLYLLVTQVVGGVGPTLVGKISDLHDLQLGLQVCVAVMVCGALLMLLVIHFIRRDGLRHPSLDVFHAESAD